ncbi:hypothetical protein D3C83_125670 [compost metagenome]
MKNREPKTPVPTASGTRSADRAPTDVKIRALAVPSANSVLVSETMYGSRLSNARPSPVMRIGDQNSGSSTFAPSIA